MMKMKFNNLFLFVGSFILLILLLQMFKKRKNFQTTITCVKGKTSKKVTGEKPKCPTGYKKK